MLNITKLKNKVFNILVKNYLEYYKIFILIFFLIIILIENNTAHCEEITSAKVFNENETMGFSMADKYRMAMFILGFSLVCLMFKYSISLSDINVDALSQELVNEKLKAKENQ